MAVVTIADLSALQTGDSPEGVDFDLVPHIPIYNIEAVFVPRSLLVNLLTHDLTAACSGQGFFLSPRSAREPINTAASTTTAAIPAMSRARTFPLRFFSMIRFLRFNRYCILLIVITYRAARLLQRRRKISEVRLNGREGQAFWPDLRLPIGDAHP